jgi:hypothetical protein
MLWAALVFNDTGAATYQVPAGGGIRPPISYRIYDEAACSVTVGLTLKILLEKQQPFAYLPTKGTCSALKQTPTSEPLSRNNHRAIRPRSRRFVYESTALCVTRFFYIALCA